MNPYRSRYEQEDRAAPPDGPSRYRAARRRLAIALATLGAGAAILCLVAQRRARPHPAAPPELLQSFTAFPPPAPDLPVATPLEPLLVANAPDRLAVLEPSEGAINVRPGEPIAVRFNRPMIDGAHVGKPVEEGVVVFDPAVRGRGRWTTRSTFSFEPAAVTWSRTHGAAMRLAPGLRSLAGEEVLEFDARTVVFDAGPRFVRGPRSTRVVPGEPVRLAFSGQVSAGALAAQMLAYEIDGGRRAMPFSLVARARDAAGETPVDVTFARLLEPGARIGIALAPPIAFGGAQPRVVEVDLAPRPKIEGIDCPESASEGSQCTYARAPGRIVDIGESLALLSSEPLGELPPDVVRVSPALDDLRVARDGDRRIVVRGDWSPGQVYELRVGELRDAQGHALARTAPLAVRSSGRTPEVRAAGGRLTWEADAEATLAFSAIHVENGEARMRAVPEGHEIEAALSPTLWLAQEPANAPLHELVPASRPNRWGSGAFAWGAHGSMATLALVADAVALGGREAPAVFVQRTDLGIDAQVLPEAVRIWVASIASAEPRSGVQVTVADAQGEDEGRGETGDDGVVVVPLARSALDRTLAVRATRGDDRAVLVVDPRTSIGPRHLGVDPGEPPLPPDAWRATVLTDRGIVRPAETVHAKVIVRSSGAELRVPRAGEHVRLVVFGPAGAAPVAERDATLSAFGTGGADFPIDADAPPGAWRVEARRDEQPRALGTAPFTVGDFQPPNVRIDLVPSAEDLDDRDPLRVDVRAQQMFGAPAAGLSAKWSIVRAPGAAYPERWAPYTFVPEGAHATRGTMAAGEVLLDAQGRATVETPVALSGPAREEATFEIEVRDASGITTTGRTRVRTYPARYEVGLRRTRAWIDHDATIDLDAIVIDHQGAPKAGRTIDAQIVREGWHTYWEWARGEGEGDEDDDGAYQARRAPLREVVKRCRMTSAEAPVHCAWPSNRAGTYLLEVTTSDEAGRASVASQRVYVAGPDEHPDRDPPGTAIALTASKPSWSVGDTAEIAFESPFPEAEALLEVTRGGVRASEARRVRAGGNVFRFPITAAMVPNAFVTLTLARPRTGRPGPKLDLEAPDLRVGLAEIAVRPPSSALDVRLAAAEGAPAGGDVPIDVTVQDDAARGVRAEVTLYAVDEGTLRVTGYRTPAPLSGLLPREAPAFVWEDLRRSLVSRVAPPLPAGSGGDGDEGEGARRVAETRERFDPTPLWVPNLVTDENGHARATLHLPDRATQYRVMAVAVADGARAGRAERTVLATMPLVVRPALPPFVAAGDRVELAAIVQNAAGHEVRVSVRPIVNDEARAPQEIFLAAHQERRVTEIATAAASGELRVRFDASTDDGAKARREARVAIVPRGRPVRSEAVGAVSGARDVTIALPEGAEDAALTLSIAAHPFVGLDTAFEALVDDEDAGVEPTASSLLGIAAYATLDTGKRPASVGPKEIRAHAEIAARRLLALQNETGGFGEYMRDDPSDPFRTAYALHALVAARAVGVAIDEDRFVRARAAVAQMVLGNVYVDRDRRDDMAFALRVLAEAGARDDARIGALFEQRDGLTPFGLAELALAMPESDRRRDALAVDAADALLATREDEARDAHVLRWYDGSMRTLGAALAAASACPIATDRATRLASKVLEARAAQQGAWWSSYETSQALEALAAFARTFDADDLRAPRVTIDGVPVEPRERTPALAWYTLPAAGAPGAHVLHVESDGAAWFALAARWVAPLGPADEVARGEGVALHRVLEDAAGKPLGPNAHVHLGDLVRVRLFLYAEHGAPPYVVVHDNLSGGLMPVDSGHETAPRASLFALLGMGPDDGDALDARAVVAARSLGDLTHRAFLPSEAVFYLAREGPGLREITYGVRAIAVGTFAMPPAELQAIYAPGFAARSAAATVTVDP